jgi:hypothetical protein
VRRRKWWWTTRYLSRRASAARRAGLVRRASLVRGWASESRQRRVTGEYHACQGGKGERWRAEAQFAGCCITDAEKSERGPLVCFGLAHYVIFFDSPQEGYSLIVTPKLYR